jgi:hypothetical protein
LLSFDRQDCGMIVRLLPVALVFLSVVMAVLAIVLPAKAGGEVRIKRSECANITLHTPAPDVAHQPGVDVHGRPVAPADVGGGSTVTIPEEITIDIGIDIEKKYGFGAGGAYTGEAAIGKVTVGKDGRAYFNGKPMTDRETAAIAEACRKLYPNAK